MKTRTQAQRRLTYDIYGAVADWVATMDTDGKMDGSQLQRKDLGGLVAAIDSLISKAQGH